MKLPINSNEVLISSLSVGTGSFPASYLRASSRVRRVRRVLPGSDQIRVAHAEHGHEDAWKMVIFQSTLLFLLFYQREIGNLFVFIILIILI